jgi:hypothetical protein
MVHFIERLQELKRLSYGIIKIELMIQLRFANCVLNFAFCVLHFAFCVLCFAFCVLRFAFCVLRFEFFLVRTLPKETKKKYFFVSVKLFKGRSVGELN